MAKNNRGILAHLTLKDGTEWTLSGMIKDDRVGQCLTVKRKSGSVFQVAWFEEADGMQRYFARSLPTTAWRRMSNARSYRGLDFLRAFDLLEAMIAL